MRRERFWTWSRYFASNWNQAKLQSGGARAQPSEQQEGANLGVAEGDNIAEDDRGVDVGDASEFVMGCGGAFWCYTHMLVEVADVLLQFQTFFEGCPCHRKSSPSGERLPRHRLHEHRLQALSHSSCPAKGRSAPECACGKVKDILGKCIADSDGERVA